MPKKTKKGGGSKREGWTEEEKLLLLQQKAHAEEELNRKKEETLTLFLKDKLQKEEKNTSINLLKLNEAWRMILRQIRHAELRDDITVFSQSFERRRDSVDSLIKCLVRDLEEAELWAGQAWCAHLQQVDRLQVLQEKRLKILLQLWEKRLEETHATLTNEREQMSVVSEQQCARLEDMTFELQHQYQQVEAELRSLYEDVRAANECAHQERMAEIGEKSVMKTSILQLENQNRPWNTSEEPIQNQNISMGAESDVKKLQDTICKLKKTLKSSEREHETAVAKLSAARQEVTQKTCEVRTEMNQAQETARKRLTELTIYSDNAVKKLQGDISKGERILRLAKVCCKQEKVLPSCISSLSSELQSQDELTEMLTEDAAKEALVCPEVQRLWRRVNVSVLQREAQRKQKEDLSRENQQLQLLLRQRLDAMTLSDPQTLSQYCGPLLAVHRAPENPAQTLSQYCGPLLAVHRAPENPAAVPAEPDRQRTCHPVTEAAHVFKYTQ
ncbi:hypothetical protein LDENG_00092120 [Lucifuga dentata]|nr:hypothetical protein LDENG_00092120 [Lucifuga dentata]